MKEIDVVNHSKLGFITNDESYRFSENLELIRTETSVITDDYTLSSGKQPENKSECNELRCFFLNEQGNEMRIDFRAYNEGIAFRYVLQNELDEEIRITKELTSFSIPKGNAWILPYDKITNWSPAYETWFANGIPVGQ